MAPDNGQPVLLFKSGHSPDIRQHPVSEPAATALPADEGDEFVLAQACGHFGAVQQVGGEITLARMEIKDLFFDRVAHEQPVDGDRPCLSNAMGAVGGLILDRRIPPWIEVDDIIAASWRKHT